MGIRKAWELLSGKVMGWMRDFVLLLPNLLVAVAVLLGFWLIARLARGLLHRFLQRVSPSEPVNRLLAQTVYVALIAAGLFVGLGILGLQKTVASLLAGAGIITLALGFAFQDIAANLMAGIYLSIQHPFRAGHLIETKDFFGVVKRVHLRWTEIRSPQGQLVLIPNKQVFENAIQNYTATGRRRIDLRVGVSYGWRCGPSSRSRPASRTPRSRSSSKSSATARSPPWRGSGSISPPSRPIISRPAARPSSA
jgi:small conductance mechanosensitive channel